MSEVEVSRTGLIRRRDALHAVYRNREHFQAAYFALETIPAVDGEEVVHCAVCANHPRCNYSLVLGADGYCSAGLIFKNTET